PPVDTRQGWGLLTRQKYTLVELRSWRGAGLVEWSLIARVNCEKAGHVSCGRLVNSPDDAAYRITPLPIPSFAAHLHCRIPADPIASLLGSGRLNQHRGAHLQETSNYSEISNRVSRIFNPPLMLHSQSRFAHMSVKSLEKYAVWLRRCPTRHPHFRRRRPRYICDT
ncbi:hypothetical protein LSAT2_010010, partial [Lamellibrachia satsuma]